MWAGYPRTLIAPMVLCLAGAVPASGQIIVGDDTDRPGPATTLAESHGGARTDVDRPKPDYPLARRSARIWKLPAFQPLVDAAPPGSVLTPPAGSYAGPVRVTKPLIIDGRGQVSIDAGGKGSVFALVTDGATLRGLRLTGSGDSYDTDDSCLDVRGNGNVIEDLRIDDCLFGIDLKQSNDSVVRGNHIRSKPLEVAMRGDAIRLWYSSRNLVEGNDISDSRDVVAWYSDHNIFRGNTSRRSRYSLHFMFSNDSLVENNRFYDNTVGIYLMYTERVDVRHNLVSHANGVAGMALGFKESSNSDIEGNDFIYCAVGVGSDLSPFQPGSSIRFHNNRFAYNGIAVHFTSELGGNDFTDNVFEGNLSDVVQSGRGHAGLNRWHGNYFDSYLGFDRNHDGIGDTPHAEYAYADRIWIEIPTARFFMLTPVMELLDFLERLAPLTNPELQALDQQPRFTRPRAGT